MMVGYAGSGKDEATRYLAMATGGVQAKLAGLLKEGVKLWFGWTDEHMENPELKNEVDPVYGISPRQALQWLGTNVMQHKIMKQFPTFRKLIARGFWVRGLVNRNRDKNLLIISDGRFPHEVTGLKNTEGVDDVVVIRIKRGKMPWYRKLFLHESEKAVDKITPDYTIYNDGTIAALQCKLDYIITNLGVVRD
jgi:hypothetical protein